MEDQIFEFKEDTWLFIIHSKKANQWLITYIQTKFDARKTAYAFMCESVWVARLEMQEILNI